jgi:hypothetical protein
MDPLEAVEALASRARTEASPRTDVRMSAVLSAAQQRPRLAPLAWSAGLSALAACVAITAALHVNQTVKVDPIRPLFQAAEVQLP